MESSPAQAAQPFQVAGSNCRSRPGAAPELPGTAGSCWLPGAAGICWELPGVAGAAEALPQAAGKCFSRTSVPGLKTDPGQALSLSLLIRGRRKNGPREPKSQFSDKYMKRLFEASGVEKK